MSDDKERRVAHDIRSLLTDLGQDVAREGLRETPDRVARMWVRELLSGEGVDLAETLSTTFEEWGAELVVVKDIPFYAMCEHHMLPFFGQLAIGYVPRGRVIGLSKFARLAEAAARRLTIQERLTRQIAEAVQTALDPLGVMVVAKAEHFCMTMRGVQRPGTMTVTEVRLGCFKEDAAKVEAFRAAAGA